VYCVAWDTKHDRLATASDDKTVRIWEPQSRQALFCLKSNHDEIESVHWSPDSKRVAATRFDSIQVTDPLTGQEVWQTVVPDGPINDLAWSPDAKQMAIANQSRKIIIYNAENGKEIRSLPEARFEWRCLQWSADGKELYAWSDQDDFSAWNVANGTTTNPTPIPKKPIEKSPRSKTFSGAIKSPNGRYTAKLAHQLREDDKGGTMIAIVDSMKNSADHSSWPLPSLSERKQYLEAQAQRAEKEQRYFAQAFYLGRLLLDEPENKQLKDKQKEAFQKHAASAK
jgi:WD40 repeat protein